MDNRKRKYILTRESTRQQTGFFVAQPEEDFTLQEALALLKLRPMDDFLHQYVLTQVGRLPKDALQQFLEQSDVSEDMVCRALVAEYLFLFKGRKHLEERFSIEEIRKLCQHTPLIYLRSFLEPDQEQHGQWIDFFRANMQEHKPLVAPDKTGLPPLNFDKPPPQAVVTTAELAKALPDDGADAAPQLLPGQTADTAEERLAQAGVELGQLMRHESSLSPIGLLRTWRFNIQIENQRNQYLLSGEQTS